MRWLCLVHNPYLLLFSLTVASQQTVNHIYPYISRHVKLLSLMLTKRLLQISLGCTGYPCLIDVLLTQGSQIMQTYNFEGDRILCWNILEVESYWENKNTGYICYCKVHQTETHLLTFKLIRSLSVYCTLNPTVCLYPARFLPGIYDLI